MKSIQTKALLIVSLLALLSLPLLADGANVATWYGNVSINGSVASSGTNVTAHVNNASAPTASFLIGTTEASFELADVIYFLDVLGAGGDTIYFRVNNVLVDQSAQNWVYGNQGRLDLTANLLENGSASDYNSSCVSGIYSEDYDGSGSWCVPSGYCAHDGTITYENAATACNGANLATCTNSVWVTTACTYACSSGACGSAPSGDGGSGGATGTVTTTPTEPEEEEPDLDDAEDDLGDAEDLIEDDPDAAEDLLDSAAETQSDVVEGSQEDTDTLDELDIDDVEELGLSADDIEEGQDLMAQAEALLLQAEAEDDLATRAELLAEALALQKQALKLLPEVTQIASDDAEVTMDADAVEDALESATTDRAIEVIEAIQAAVPSLSGQITISASLATYRISNAEDTSDNAYRSHVTFTITSTEDMEDVVIVETIPKSVAKDVAELIFPAGMVPEILQSDPIIAWSFASLSADEERIVSYQIKNKITSLKSEQVASSGVEGVNVPTFFDLVDLIDSYYIDKDIGFWSLIDSINKYYGG